MSNETLDTYQKIAKDYSDTHFNPNFWIQEFTIFLKMLQGKRIVDLGCGAGRDAVLFSEAGFDYLGVDGSSEMLTQAQQRLPNGHFQVMDLTNLQLISESCDGFWASASLLHLPKNILPEVLKKIAACLTTEGAGFISVKEKRDLEEGIITENKYGGIKRYFSFYTREEMRNILEKNGFSVVQTLVHPEEDTNWLCYFVKKQMTE